MGVKDMMANFSGNGGVNTPVGDKAKKLQAEKEMLEAQKKAKEAANKFNAPTDLLAATKVKGAWQKDDLEKGAKPTLAKRISKRISQSLGLSKKEEEPAEEATPEEEPVEQEEEEKEAAAAEEEEEEAAADAEEEE